MGCYIFFHVILYLTTSLQISSFVIHSQKKKKISKSKNMVKFLGFRRVNTDQYSIDGSLAIFASSLEELIKTKVQRGGDEPGRAKCFRCVLEAPRARRWAEIGRDIEGTGITGRRTVLERTPGALDRYFHGSRLLNGRGPRYYESALNRDSVDKSADNLEKSSEKS